MENKKKKVWRKVKLFSFGLIALAVSILVPLPLRILLTGILPYYFNHTLYILLLATIGITIYTKQEGSTFYERKL